MTKFTAMTSIASELNRTARQQYIETMNNTELAYWLVQSFSPARYRDRGDVVEYACRLLYTRSRTGIVDEFINRLWGMHGLEPDHAPNTLDGKVINFKKNAK
jgi:hypothetical protein